MLTSEEEERNEAEPEHEGERDDEEAIDAARGAAGLHVSAQARA